MQGVESTKTSIYTIIFLVSISVNMTLFLKLIDKSISLDYAKKEQEFLIKRSLDNLAVLNELCIGFPKDNFRGIVLNLMNRGMIVKEQPTEIQIGDIVFQFKKDKINHVDYIK